MPGFSEQPKFNKPDDSGSEKPEGKDLRESDSGRVSNDIENPSGKERREGRSRYNIELEVKTEEQVEQEGESSHEAIFSEPQQKVEHKTESIELEVEESTFEYPEEIRRTSGVKGYIRKQISWDEMKAKYPEDSDWLEKMMGDEDISMPEEMKENFMKLLRKLSGGEFPDKTFNHLVGRVGSTDTGLIEQSKAEGLAAQKIFDPQTFKRLAEKKDRWKTAYANLSFFNSESGEYEEDVRLETGQFSQSPEKFLEGLAEQMDDPSTYAMADRGLSISNKGEFWTDQDVSGMGLPTSARDAPRLMIFGFGDKNEGFRKYLKKAKQVLEKQEGVRGLKYKERQTKTIKHFLGEEQVKNFAPPGSEEDHPWLPVINGHPEVPDLRWCNADWAYIPTENGINVLQFISEDMEAEGGVGNSESSAANSNG